MCGSLEGYGIGVWCKEDCDFDICSSDGLYCCCVLFLLAGIMVFICIQQGLYGMVWRSTILKVIECTRKLDGMDECCCVEGSLEFGDC